MTKRRPPLSIDSAIVRIAGHLDDGFDAMAKLVGRHVKTVRNWGDPDKDDQIPIDCAIALDLAYIAAGGTGAPIFESYALKLELAEADRFGDRHQLLRTAQTVAKETGEATAAIIGASHAGATAADRAAALKEATEARQALDQVIPLLAEKPATPAADAQPP